LALCALLIGPAFVGAPGRGAHARALESSGSLGSLPPAARGVVSAALGGDDRGFWVSRAGTGLTASNPAQCLAFTFSGGAVAVAGGQGRASLAVAGVGYGRRLRSLGPAASVAQRNRVGFDYGMLSEWFVNGPLGLEQGFTLRRPPTGSRRGPLSIVMRVSGSLGVRVARGAESAEFLARGGRVALSYTGLRATDASGRVLEAWLSASAGGLAIRVGDRGARYPVTVDPFIQQGPTLVGTDASGSDRQGSSVALSADGNTALVGGLTDDGNRGAAWVFTRSGGVWRQQGPKLVGTGAIGAAAQGVSVVLSADGNTALVGGPTDDGNRGAAWVFTRSGGVWRQQGPKLVGTGAIGAARQGSSVVLSADGNTALVGGPSDHGDRGAAWVFTRSGGVWRQHGSKLVGTGATGAAQEGPRVALSPDGNTALLGGPYDDGGAGAAWVFTRSGGVWSQQGSKLTGAGATGANAYQGWSVALSADGNTALLGGLGNGGAAWVFTRSGGVWSQQGPKLVGTGATGNSHQGTSVALSADGNTALVGGPFDNDHAGAAWVFTRSGGVWRQQGSKLTGAGATGSYPLLGSSVALSADGNTALLGGPHDNGFAVGGAGAAWVFTRSDGVWSQQGSKLVGAGATASQQGLSVALSADGNTALVGGPGDGGTGAAWVFTRSGGVWRQQGPKLVGTGAIVGFTPAREGFSVALSADGNTALLGGPGDNNGLGAAWVFTRSRGVWSQQGPKLVGTGGQGSLENQGYSVALSADGNTALVGGPHDNSFGFGAGGAAWVFTRAGGLWRQQGPKLVGTGATGGPPHVGGAARQGFSVALSADGNTALVGGPNDGGGGINGHSGHGAAWVFTRSGGVWTQQGPKLVGTDSTFDDNQGFSVALSADGNTALVGGPFDHRNGFGNAGAAWVFTRTGGAWTQQGRRLIGKDEHGRGDFGTSVALSANGNTALVGGPRENGGAGAAWLFTRSGGVWSQPGSKLTALAPAAPQSRATAWRCPRTARRRWSAARARTAARGRRGCS
jgi:FG-GAP repeat